MRASRNDESLDKLRKYCADLSTRLKVVCNIQELGEIQRNQRRASGTLYDNASGIAVSRRAFTEFPTAPANNYCDKHIPFPLLSHTHDTTVIMVS